MNLSYNIFLLKSRKYCNIIDGVHKRSVGEPAEGSLMKFKDALFRGPTTSFSTLCIYTFLHHFYS